MSDIKEKQDSKDDFAAEVTVTNPNDLTDHDGKERDQISLAESVEFPEPEKNAKGEHIIRTGADAARYLLSLRDDGDRALTLRSFIIGTTFAAACSVMQMYSEFLRQSVSLNGAFLGIIIYFTVWIRLAKFLHRGDFGLKEHVVAFVIASQATTDTTTVLIFAVQDLFFDQSVKGTTIALATLSMSLFGYGLAGILRPMTVWAIESVYWTQIPQVKMFQGMHWDNQLESKRMRWFWGVKIFVGFYQILPTYMFPWLSAVSIPCLAAMNATGSKGQTLTNIFGSTIGSWAISQPLKLQANTIIGLVFAYITTAAVYYGNAWNALKDPFQSASLPCDDGTRYVSTKIFDDGILNHEKLAAYGLPHIAGTYAWGLVLANAALGALFAHVLLFWGKDIVRTVSHWRKGHAEDPHHKAMERYKEAPMWWYMVIMVFAFATGIACCATQDIQLPWWAFIVLRSVLDNKRDVLLTAHGNAQWTGVNLQSSETNATTWALSKYLYSSSGEYFLVPLAVVIGFGVVTLHWLLEKKVKKIGPWATNDYNLAVIIQNMGHFAGTGITSSSDLVSVAAGFFNQIYLRDYHPKIFKDYSFLLASGMDGGAALNGFILTLAVFGARQRRHTVSHLVG